MSRVVFLIAPNGAQLAFSLCEHMRSGGSLGLSKRLPPRSWRSSTLTGWPRWSSAVSYTHLRAHETSAHL
eukprot:13235800-Alexandrium_andersonii.AAC.1